MNEGGVGSVKEDERGMIVGVRSRSKRRKMRHKRKRRKIRLKRKKRNKKWKGASRERRDTITKRNCIYSDYRNEY